MPNTLCPGCGGPWPHKRRRDGALTALLSLCALVQLAQVAFLVWAFN